MIVYAYEPLRRPPAFGSLPCGWRLIERGCTVDCAPARYELPTGIRPFGLVGYEIPLSEAIVEAFELSPEGTRVL